MGMSGQLRKPSRFTPGIEPKIGIWPQNWYKKSTFLTGVRTPGRPARRLVPVRSALTGRLCYLYPESTSDSKMVYTGYRHIYKFYSKRIIAAHESPL